MENTFEHKIRHKEILFRYAKGKSILEVNEIHPYHEILYFIKGEGKFYSDDFDTELRENLLFIIPQNTYHRFSLTNQNSYMRLALNFTDICNITDIDLLLQQKVSVLYPKSDIEFLLNKICFALSHEEKDKQTQNLIYGAFLMLLAEISCESHSIIPRICAEKNAIISKCIKHIQNNLSSRLTIENTASLLNVSCSTLSQLFKKQLGISFYRYVTQKRLNYANSLISNGDSPTKIYRECGFNDYATFYKAFVKMYGIPPSKNR